MSRDIWESAFCCRQLRAPARRAASKASPQTSGAPSKTQSTGETVEKPLIKRPEGILALEIVSHFDWFNCNPIALPLDRMVDTSLFTDAAEPPSVTSSKHPNLSLLDNELRIGCRVRQNSSGPNGSPCCTPSWERIERSPNCRIETSL